MKQLFPYFFCSLFALCVGACQEETQTVGFSVSETSRVTDSALDQYIFRAFIDLMGQAPTEAQLAEWRQHLRLEKLSEDSRRVMIKALQSEPQFRADYAANLYSAAKVRFLENVPDAEIETRFIGQGGPEDDQRLQELLSWQADFLAENATIIDLQRRAIHNLVFDEINMGSFNYVRASFDNLLFRYPSEAEFQAGFDMVDKQQSRTLFSKTGASKTAYVDIIINSDEALEGLVIWQYDQLLARRPSAAETIAHLPAIRSTKQLAQLQLSLMSGNEYANF